MSASRGLLIVLSGPSGVGKGTVRAAVFANNQFQYVYSVSATTRAQRPGEVDGKDYYFVSREEFETMIQNEDLLEYAEYVGNYYGTPIQKIEENLAAGHDVFLEIEVQGAMKVKERMPEGIFIFLAPPNLEELESRITGRGTDAAHVIQERMATAKEEIELMQHYDYVVVNDQVQHAVDKINAIIQSEHLKVERVVDQIRHDMETYYEKERI
ncbi:MULTISPECIES: guanylate kinase [Abiotrophia]|jgi:guanylate kinase|uniref:Guanylate kinase n=2 Tax=Abiotrophia defectiva TaxID=46125 RepID=W1Q5E2_ABIDE|nr:MULTISPECIES: guanylate kinase [Abiotrophia]RKW19563.1 MAG: guanylate kinase [Catonella sp.]ESK66437.1 guanylate kinase [Abiotrophia defectiva ATCC 49176]MBF0935050.1 guanylate kinase [Abiotrophia defectiva]MBF0936009.1 guanylate kinase [Abiotrophia sp.]MBF0942180.1 guanylate kinase [Abiotrophia sp.]